MTEQNEWTLIQKEETTSTNDDVAKLLDKGMTHVAVLSNIQTQGRGRTGNYWYSPKGGVWLSLGLHCDLPATDLVTPLVKIMAKTLEEVYGRKFIVKLPNDIFLNGKKVMGILMETKIQDHRILRIVLGLGLNVNNEVPKEIKTIATSLKNEGIITTVSEAFEIIFQTATNFLKRIENKY